MRTSPLHVLHVIGVSHRTASMKVREQLVLTSAEAAAWLDQQRAAGRCAAILSTCNRFEVYWSGSHDLEPWLHEFVRARGVDPGTAVTRRNGEACARHLFRVAAGLDSQILGETEILGQVRRAHQAALDARTSSRELDAMFSSALAAGRRVRRETRVGRHQASVSSAAVNVALGEMPRPRCPTVVILGAGEVAAGVLRALRGQRVGRVVVLNRCPERGAALAAQWNVESRPWTDLGSVLSDADLLFVTTGAKHALVRAEDLAAATGRRGSDLVILDLAVPRNVEPTARRLARVQLLDLDDLEARCCPAAGQPSVAIAEAQRVVENELMRLEAALRARTAAPRLAHVHQLGAQLAREEADRALATLDRLSDVERQVVRNMAERLVRRVLYPVSQTLREASGPTDTARWSA